MVGSANISTFYELENGYTITHLDSRICHLIFRDKNYDIVAIIEGCQNNLSRVRGYKERLLSEAEQTVLQHFIKAQKWRITTDVAAALGLSIVFHDMLGAEEYLTEVELKKLLGARVVCSNIFVGKLKAHSLRIQAFSKNGHYDLCNAQVKKLIISQSCDLEIDMRDNAHIESVQIEDNFHGSLSLSRSTIKNIVIQNDCRCNLSVLESKHCFNLQIADIYSGNLLINDSCFHRLKIGYYCYADIKLSNNWGHKDVRIGDSFRGSLVIDDVHLSGLNIGKDCKGKVSLSSRDSTHGSKEIKIAEDFAGKLDLHHDASVEKLEVGSRARGHFNLNGQSSIKYVRFDKYFNGYADFSHSPIEYVRAEYGSSGDMVFNDCNKLIMVELPRYKNSNIITEKDPIEIISDSRHLAYRFLPQKPSNNYFPPLYKRIYESLREILES